MKGLRLDEMNSSELELNLREGFSDYFEGCNNEPLRVLSDSGHAEWQINTLTAGKPNHLFRDADGWAEGSAAVLFSTLEHMQVRNSPETRQARLHSTDTRHL